MVRSTNPCDYVFAADVAPIVGGPVNNGILTTGMGPRPGDSAISCVFQPHGTDGIPVSGSNADVQFIVVEFIDRTTFDTWRGMTPEQAIHITPVSGIGDEAFEAGGIHFAMLFAARGTYRLVFEVAAGWTSFIGPAEQLARVVVPRLPSSSASGRLS
jgi:hypothetical protein